MRVSQYFKLKQKQAELQFVDVDIARDLRLFVDPRAIRLLHGEWADKCVHHVKDFFSVVLAAIGDQDESEALRLLDGLHEPNETHLGDSRDRSDGRGIGGDLAQDVYDRLSTSKAVKSGMVTDLEDTALMVPGIAADMISDITTNIIRGPLVEFTQACCSYYGIRTRPVDYGPFWDADSHDWVDGAEQIEMPVTSEGIVLLVPRTIVRRQLTLNPAAFLTSALPYLQVTHARNGEFVRLIRGERRPLPRGELRKKYAERWGGTKGALVELMQMYPEILGKYHASAMKRPTPPLGQRKLAQSVGSKPPDWGQLLSDVVAIAPGEATATEYHRTVERLLTAVFYPTLDYPMNEFPIHEGRKRIDITYSNMAVEGFFRWVKEHHPAMYVFVECKNYSKDPANEELDQLAGRFGPSRGQLGLLVARAWDDKEAFLRRCRDTAKDLRGFIIPMDDEDLRELVEARKKSDSARQFRLLRERFDYLVS